MNDPLAPGMGRPLFFNSIPKCGKNLIVSFLSKLGYQRIWFPDDGFNRALYAKTFRDPSGRAAYLYGCPSGMEVDVDASIDHQFRTALEAVDVDQYVHEHVVFDPRLGSVVQDIGIACVFVYRDPRDALVSALNWAKNHGKPAPTAAALAGLADEDALVTLISGNPGLVSFLAYFDSFYGWKDFPSVLPLRFEDMIGPRGGGSEIAQRRTFTLLAERIGWNGDPQLLEEAIQSAYNPRAGTFHRGQIGTWKEYFTPAIADEFRRHGARLLKKWGYE